ncbi:MAG: hypothetical protein DWQ07_18645 [Chloroflexi bacterium]|nr:MAG: hypothetical protein DWQ07_18645 [Chloroflexota bacterium]MBL1194951.1 hypothetical protein [Chloroflexota bacterium]NOH12241.1 hypothetical protein [Chloroflexota bacterium]
MKRRGLSLSIVLLIFAIFVVAAINLELIPEANPETRVLPANLAGIEMYSSVTGAEAILDISRLHGKDFPINSANIGSYGSKHEITVWVASTSLVSIAQGMILDMEESISVGTTPFRPEGDRDQDGRRIYELSGMGQLHFYFRSDNNVVWLAADPRLANEALGQLLEYFP